MMRGTKTLRVYATKEVTEEQLARMDKAGMSEAHRWLLHDLKKHVAQEYPAGSGMVLDESTVEFATHDREIQMYARNVKKMRITGMMIEHDRSPVVRTVMDALGFTEGSTFREASGIRSGRLIVATGTKLELFDYQDMTLHGRMMSHDVKLNDIQFPLSLLWEAREPVEFRDMLTGNAHYDYFTGIPAIAQQAIDLGLEDSPLREGLL